MSFTVDCVQLDTVWEDKEANFTKVRELLGAASPAPGSLVVLPEMFATGFSQALEVTAEPVGGVTERFLAELARTHQCGVIGGLVTHGNGGKGNNQALAVAPTGEVLARYTKMRPFSLGGETGVHASGTGPLVFRWQGVAIAPLICYDLRFPEIAREAVRLGAEVLVYIAAWPVKRQQHWIALLQARAIENQAYVIGVNRCGTDPQFAYSGRSLIVDPHGVVVGDASEQERVVRTVIDERIVRDWRVQFPALRDAGIFNVNGDADSAGELEEEVTRDAGLP